MNKHAMANEYKILCSEANKMSRKENRGETTSNGWKVVDNKYDRRSNFKGVLYEKDGQYALCFVGTDRFSAKDWGANAKMALTGESEQIRQARNFAKEMRDAYGLNSENTESIGHSEGGTEATVVGIQYGLKTTTFNAYGAGGDYVDKNKNYDDLVTNYRDPHDPISKLRANVGTGLFNLMELIIWEIACSLYLLMNIKNHIRYLLTKFPKLISQERILQIWIPICSRYTKARLITAWQTIE